MRQKHDDEKAYADWENEGGMSHDLDEGGFGIPKISLTEEGVFSEGPFWWPHEISNKKSRFDFFLIPFLFFFAHSSLYASLLLFAPDFAEKTSLADFTSLRWLDPALWIFWFLGWILIERCGIFFVRKPLFLTIGSLYATSIAPLLFWGIARGFWVYVVFLCLALLCIKVSK